MSPGVLVAADHAVGVGGAARTARSREGRRSGCRPSSSDSSAGPRIRSALARELHGRCAEVADGGRDAQNAVGSRVEGGEAELDFGVGCLRPDVVLVGVLAAEIRIQDVELGLDLGVRCCLEDVEDHRNGQTTPSARCSSTMGPLGGVVLDLVGVREHQLDVLLVGRTGPLGKAAGTLGSGEGGGLGHQSEGHSKEDSREEVEFGHGVLRYGEGNTLTMPLSIPHK